MKSVMYCWKMERYTGTSSINLDNLFSFPPSLFISTLPQLIHSYSLKSFPRTSPDAPDLYLHRASRIPRHLVTELQSFMSQRMFSIGH